MHYKKIGIQTPYFACLIKQKKQMITFTYIFSPELDFKKTQSANKNLD